MNQPIIEVKERKSILSMGIIFTVIFGAIMIMSMLAVEDASMMIYCGFTFGLFMILGLYLILAYKNHSLKVFSGGSMEFSGVLGKKKAFQYRDIAKIEQKYMKTTLSIALKDVNGKRLAKVEGNMMGYEELMQWLYDQQVTAAQTQEELSKFNTTGAGPAVVSPVKIQGTGKVGRFFLGLFGVILLLFGTIALLAVVIGAALGGLVWIFFYKLGRIAAISGYLAVIGSVWGWSKFGRREMTGRAWAMCIAVGVGMIFLANYISYAWEIVEAINASSPGRAQFIRVLTNMPSLMTEWDLWGAFVADLGMGILFACVAGFSGRLGKMKKNKL